MQSGVPQRMPVPMLPAPGGWEVNSINSEPSDINLRELWQMLRRRKKLILIPLITLGLAATILTVLTTPRYEATAVVELGKEQSDMVGSEIGGTGSTAPSDSLDYTVTQQTQAQALASSSLLYQVAEQLDLEKREEFHLKPDLFGFVTADQIKAEYAKPLENAPLRRYQISKTFGKNLSVKAISGTRLIEVHFLSPDPQVAVRVVNTLVNDYTEHYYKQRYTATVQVSDWLSKQLNDLRSQVENGQEKLLDSQRRAGILGADESNNVTMTKLEDLNRQLTTAEANRIMAQTVYQVVKSGDPELISNTVGNNLLGSQVNPGSANALSLIQSLRAQEVQLKAQYAQAATKYGAAFPALVQMRTQLTELQSAIQAEVQKLQARTQTDYQIAKTSEDMLRSSFEKQKTEVDRLNNAALPYTLQKHEVDANRRLYDDLSTKLKEAGVLAGLHSTNLTIIDPGRTSSRPARPRYPLNIGVGLGAGLFLGILWAFFKEAFDSTVRTSEQVEAISALPSLGILPEAKHSIGGWRPFKKLRPADLSVLTAPSSYMAEAFRSLRTSVLTSEFEAPRVILVTSALPGEGKSTTSLNAAITLAQQGSRVLLVEADLRRPHLRETLGLETNIGLTEVLTGGFDGPLSAGEFGHPEVPNLFILPAGTTTGGQAEMLGSRQMKAAVERWRHEFDFVVIDTPPVLSVTDAVLVSRHADAVVLVVRYEHTKQQSLLRARDILMRAKANIAGVVVNRVTANSPDNYYGPYTSAGVLKGYSNV